MTVAMYSYRRSVSISSPITLYNYQVQVVVDTSSLISAGKMLSDCRDVAFTDLDGRVLRHYVEPGTCNTTSTRFFVNVPYVSGTATIYMFYGNSVALDLKDPHRALILGGSPAEYPRLRLYGDAAPVYPSYIRLTPASSGRWGGVVGKDGALPVPAPTMPTGLYAKLVFCVGSCTSAPADAVWLGAYDDTYIGTSEDVVRGGYHFTFDIYQSRICFTKSTTDNGPGIACYSTSISTGVWHVGEVYFWYDGGAAYAKILYDGNQVIDASDTTPQSNVVNGSGIVYVAARTSSRYCEFRLREFLIVKWYPGVSTSVGDEEFGPFAVQFNALSAVDVPHHDAIIGTTVGNELPTTGKTFNGVDLTHAFYHMAGSRISTTLPVTNRVHNPVAFDAVEVGTLCTASNYAYLMLVRRDGEPIDGLIYLHLLYPRVYAQAIVRNGIAKICVPLDPTKFRQSLMVVVDNNNNIYTAYVTNIEEIPVTFTGLSLSKSFIATAEVTSQLALPSKFVIELAKLVNR